VLCNRIAGFLKKHRTLLYGKEKNEEETGSRNKEEKRDEKFFEKIFESGLTLA